MFFKDRFLEWFIKIITLITSLIIFLVIFFIINEGIPIFREVGIKNFVFGTNWSPIGVDKHYGILNFILGSMYVSLLAICIAMPIGFGCSVFLCYMVKKRIRKLIISFIDMIAGLPSVIFGFIGLIILVKFFEIRLGMTTGECVLCGGVLLGVMILPFIIDNCLESIQDGKELYERSSLDLGVSRWYTLRRVIIPYSKKSILLSSILGFSRAMGETMAVMMVIGNSPIMPKLLGKGETIPSLIALEMGSVEYGSLHYSALYGAGLVLIVILLGCNIVFSSLKNIKRG
ncbi:MAG: phosphate ABC transporter permease subunit PstC [Clostridium sp.]